MTLVRLTLVLLVCLVTPAAAWGADGGVYLYLQPFPPEAARLSFTLASIVAVSSDGSEIPLKTNLANIRPGDVARQRLLASGRVPIGSYVGFALRVTKASLKGAPQDPALAIPDVPVRIDAQFIAGQPLVLWLSLRYQESVTGGMAFSPAFTVITPPRPIASRVGFVSNSGSNTITVFDKGLGQVVGVIDTCSGPAGMALDQHRRRVYVACSNDDEVQSVDLATGHITDRTRVSPGDRPRELALTPDGLTLVVVNGGSSSVSFFDAVSLNRLERLNVGSGPAAILIDPAGKRAFVFDTLSSSLSVIDVPGRTVAATVATEAAPVRGQFSARGDRLYVIHERSPYMSVLDPIHLTMTTRARLRIGISAIAVDTVRDLICVGGLNDPAVEFYDPHALMALYSMRTRAGTSYMAFDPEDNSLYMISPQTRSVAVARLADRKVTTEFDVGDSPYVVVIMGEK